MKKYNIFSEVKISNIILIILGIGLCIMSLATDEKFHFTYLILTLLLISIFIRDLRKYFNLKNNGKLIKNANYKIIYQNGKNYLKVFYKDNKNDDICFSSFNIFRLNCFDIGCFIDIFFKNFQS